MTRQQLMNKRRFRGLRSKRIVKALLELEYQLPFIIRSFENYGYGDPIQRANWDEQIFRTLANRALRYLDRRKNKTGK